MNQDAIKRAADEVTAAVDAFIATVRFPNERARCASVIAVLDGADDGARAVYVELRRAAPVGELPDAAIPRDKVQTLVCPYARLKASARAAGYRLTDAQDKDPAAGDVRVATFTQEGVVVATYRLAHPVGQA